MEFLRSILIDPFADMFAALVLLTAMLTITIVELFAIGQRRLPMGADPRIDQGTEALSVHI